MSPLIWYRLDCKLVDDERIRLLAFEDRWHYVALNCCKGQGILDNTTDPVLLRRKLGVKLGLQLRELEALALRLGEVDLIDADTFQPRDWDQRLSPPPSSTPRVRKHRAKKKELCDAEQKNEQRSAQQSRNVSSALLELASNALQTETKTKTKTSTYTETTTLDWTYLSDLREQKRAVVVEILEEVDPDLQQDLMDELAGALRHGVIKRSWPGWLRNTAANAKANDFNINYGMEIRAARKRRAEAEAEQHRRRAQADAEARQRDPAELARRQEVIRAANADLNDWDLAQALG